MTDRKPFYGVVQELDGQFHTRFFGVLWWILPLLNFVGFVSQTELHGPDSTAVIRAFHLTPFFAVGFVTVRPPRPAPSEPIRVKGESLSQAIIRERRGS